MLLALPLAACGASATSTPVDLSAALDLSVPPDLVPPPPDLVQPPPTTPLPGWEGRLFAWQISSPLPAIASRTVTVLVPPGYSDPGSAAKRYPVMYMHDGGNCLDHDPFGHGGWQVHTISYDLESRGLMAPAIFVFVDNDSQHRAEEYVPGQGVAPGPTAEAYLDFLEHTVVPFVDATYRTIPDPGSRVLGGSSYGGLISLYGAWTRPAVWRRVMAMSTAFAYDFTAQVDREAPPKKPLLIYLDSGTTDYGGGDDDMTLTVALRDLLEQKGWVLGDDLKHVDGQGDSHSEDFWRGRLPGALPFVLPP